MKKLQREEGQGILLNKRTKQEKEIIKETNLQVLNIAVSETPCALH